MNVLFVRFVCLCIWGGLGACWCPWLHLSFKGC